VKSKVRFVLVPRRHVTEVYWGSVVQRQARAYFIRSREPTHILDAATKRKILTALSECGPWMSRTVNVALLGYARATMKICTDCFRYTLQEYEYVNHGYHNPLVQHTKTRNDPADGISVNHPRILCNLSNWHSVVKYIHNRHTVYTLINVDSGIQ
jgi:hypothetical protein